ncbi:SPW repeat protein [Actinosynnema sp. NPDC053489]|uniref:SPW repeat domain-containing protein n=1 Tax=Actinosynnema sp. NPDC053489 TaxID=3363916 RepID=UPI0037CB4178
MTSPARRGAGWDAVVTFGVAVSFLAGLWLLMAPFALGYRVGDFDPRWNDVLAGFAVAVCSLVHALASRETPWLAPVLAVVGLWLVLVSFTRAGEVSVAVVGVVVLVAGSAAVVRAVVWWWRPDRPTIKG